MKTTPYNCRRSGYVSFVMVISTTLVLTVMMVFAYTRAVTTQKVQAGVQLNVDYSEKEEAILRGILSITPNRAIRAMQTQSDANTTNRNPLRWQDIFNNAITMANARQSITTPVMSSLNLPNAIVANSGDSALATHSRIFTAISPDSGYMSAGINRSFGTGYPPALTVTDTTTSDRDKLYPIISDLKDYGSHASGLVGLPTTTYPNFNILTYPQINFGYAEPGDPFVAKRNWWAFSLDVADHDDDKTMIAKSKRDFVLSIYEIPSQLAISAASFMSLGANSAGEAWENVTIAGGIFAGQAVVEGDTELPALASRRGMSFSSGTTIGGQSFAGNPFAPGLRETFQLTQGAFFPVSLASESGRAAFVPISRGADYFDRFAHAAESSVLSTTSWNNYSVGALQCAMRLDVTAVQSAINHTPTMLRFSYLQAGNRQTFNVPLTTAAMSSLPAGYVRICNENQSYTFSSQVDVAYGAPGGFTFRSGLTGTIAFTNATFGDPLVGTPKGGYWRPRAPMDTVLLPSGQYCINTYPERLPAFLTAIGADGPAVNNSLVVNVDYSTTGLNSAVYKPNIPCTNNDFGLILKECDNLSPFTRGFSLVTNLRLYIGDDFNTTAGTPPSGYTPPVGQTYFPPCSLFSPEKRYGVESDAFAVSLTGQVGSLAIGDKVNAVDANPTLIRPLDTRGGLSGDLIDSSSLTVNLRPINHPAELPPIFMLNWLVVLEERRN